MSLSDVLQLFGLVMTGIGFLVGGVSYAYKVWRKEDDSIDDSTIHRLNEAINSLKTENDIVKNSNNALNDRVTTMQKIIDQQNADIKRLTDLLTSRQNFEEIVNILTTFKPVLDDIKESKINIMAMITNQKIMIKQHENIIRDLDDIDKKMDQDVPLKK